MTNVELLRQCFSYLVKDLHRIENINPDKDLPFREHAINDIGSHVFECDPEDALLFLSYYQKGIDHLKEKVPTIINTLAIQDKGNPFEPSYIVKAHDIKEALKSSLIERLDYYHLELTKLVSRIQDQQDELGLGRFSSAGFKLKIDLKNEDVASFFKALLDTKIISKEDGSPLTKTDLATFINKNFSSNTVLVISTASLKNSLSTEIPYSQNIRDLVKKLSKHVNGWLTNK